MDKKKIPPAPPHPFNLPKQINNYKGSNTDGLVECWNCQKKGYHYAWQLHEKLITFIHSHCIPIFFRRQVTNLSSVECIFEVTIADTFVKTLDSCWTFAVISRRTMNKIMPENHVLSNIKIADHYIAFYTSTLHDFFQMKTLPWNIMSQIELFRPSKKSKPCNKSRNWLVDCRPFSNTVRSKGETNQ